MEYTVLFFNECTRCKQFESNYKFRNCGFDIVKKDGITRQIFECTRCKFKWTKELHNEDSIDNRSTLRRKTG